MNNRLRNRIISGCMLLAVVCCFGYSSGPEVNAAGKMNKSCVVCHLSNNPEIATRIELLENGKPVSGFRPGGLYTLNITAEADNAEGWGIKFYADIASGSAMVTRNDLPEDLSLQQEGDKSYILHTQPIAGKKLQLNIPWQAPSEPTESLNFIAELVAANLDGTAQDDQVTIVSQQFTTTPLEIVWRYFEGDAAETHNHLRWGVGDHKQLLQFVIEKSSDGRNFEELAMVPYDASMSDQDYTYNDYQLTPACYYRLKSVSTSGKEAFYKTIFVYRKDKTPLMYYLRGQHLVIELMHQGSTREIEASLHSLEGARVSGVDAVLHPGMHELLLSRPVVAGVYILSIYDQGEQLLNEKILIQ